MTTTTTSIVRGGGRKERRQPDGPRRKGTQGNSLWRRDGENVRGRWNEEEEEGEAESE